MNIGIAVTIPIQIQTITIAPEPENQICKNVRNGGFLSGHVLQVMHALAIMWWFLTIWNQFHKQICWLPPAGF